MWFNGWRRWLRQRTVRRQLERTPPRPRRRLHAEYLEDRVVPANLDIDLTGNLIYTAAAGEANNLTISFLAGDYVFNDTGATISVTGLGAGGWVGNGTNTVSGPVGSVTTISIDLGDLDDTLTFSLGIGVASLSAVGGGQTGDVAMVAGAMTVLGDFSLIAFQTITINATVAVNNSITLDAGGALAIQASLFNSSAATSGDITLTAGGALTVNAGVNVITGDATTASGDIVVTAGSLSHAGTLITGNVSDADAAGDQTPTSGSITVLTTTGITGAGILVTGNAELSGADEAGNDVATTGDINLTVSGAGIIGLSAINALITGDATRPGAVADTAVTGNISLVADRVNNNGVNSLDLQQGGATGAATMTMGLVSATTDVGEVLLTTDAPLRVGIISAAGRISLTADDMELTGDIIAGGNVNLQARSSPRVITLGSNPGGTLGLDDAELDLIATTTGILIIGDTANTGNLQLTGAITAPIGWDTLDLITGGAITDNGGTLTVTNLALRAATGIGAGNDINTVITNLAAVNGTGNIEVTNTGPLTIATVNGLVGVTITGATGEIIIRANSPLTINSPVSGPGNITLQASDSGAPGDTLTINANVTSTGGGIISLIAGDDILHTSGTIQSVGGASNEVRFTADNEGALADGDRGEINQSGGNLIAGNAVFRAFENVLYTSATNNVGTLAASVTGANSFFAYRDANGLTVNTVNGVSGITTVDGNVTLQTAGTAAGALTINNVITAGTGIVRFLAGTAAITGSVTQNATGVITAAALGVLASGDVILCAATNDVNTLAVNRLGAMNILVEFRDADDLIIGAVAALAVGTITFGGAVGVVSGTGNINFNVGNLIINQPLNAGSGDIRIVAATTVTQIVTGFIIADELGILAGGDVTLCLAVNDVNTLAINRTAAANILIEYRDGDDLIVGAVAAGGGCGFTGATGLVSGTGDINLRTAEIAAGALTLNAVVNATTGDVRLVAGTAAIAGSITQIAAGVITADELGILASGDVVLCAAVNDVNTLAVNRLGVGPILIEFRDGDDLTIGAVAAGGNCGFTGATGVNSSTGNINFNVGSLTITQPLNAGTGDIRIVAATTVTQNATGVVTADELGIQAGGDVTLCLAINDVNTLAVNRLGIANILVEFRDGDDLTIGLVVAGGGCGFTTATGIVSGTGNINFNVGNLIINQPLNAGSGDIRIVAATTVTQILAGFILADELGILAGGNVTLCLAVNDVNTVAINRTGVANILIEYRDFDDLIVGAVVAGGGCGFTGAAGLVSGTGNINVRTAEVVAGALTLNAVVNATTGDVRLVAGTAAIVGSITQSAAGVITADELGILASGDVTLCAAVNDVNTLAVNRLGVGPILIEFRDGDDLTIGTVAAGGGCGFTGATGVNSSNGNINFNVFSLTINLPLNAGTGDIRIVAATTVTQNVAGFITADELGIQAGGDVTLCLFNDVNALAVNRLGAANILVEFRDGDDLTIATVAAGGGCGFTGATGVVSGTGNINFNVGNLVINQPLNAGTGDIRIVAITTVTQSAAGVITADELGILARGDVTLCMAANDVNTVAINRDPQNANPIEFRDVDDLIVGAVAAGGGCGFTGATGVQTIFGDTNFNVGSLVINQLLFSVNIRIVAGTTVTQSAAGRISAFVLGILAGGNVTLCAADNNMNTVAINTNGLIELRVINPFGFINIGTVAAGGNCGFTGATGIVSTNNNINLQTVAGLGISQPLNAGTGDIRIVAGTVSQDTAGIITADELGIQAGGAVRLCIAINDVNTLAISTNGLVEFRDGDDLTISAVAAGGNCGFTGATGIVSTNNDINLRTGTSLTLNQPLNAGTADIRIVAGTTVTQIATGVVTADELGIQAGGAVTLCAATTNDVNTLAINTTGAVEFRDADDLTIGVVTAGGNCGFTGATGVVSTGNDLSLRAGAALTLTQALTAGAGTVRLEAVGAVTQAVAAAITGSALGVRAGAAITLTALTNNVATFAAVSTGAGSAIEYTDADAVALGTVTANACFSAAVTGVSSTNGDVILCSFAGSLAVNASIAAGTATVRLQAAGAITQAAAPVAITAAALGVRAGGAITLISTANNVTTFAAASTGVGSAVEYTDADGFALGTVTASGCFTVTTTGISSANGDITLCSVAGNLAVNASLAAGTGTVRLQAGGAVTQAAAPVAITGATLGVRAGGAITLTSTANDVTTFAAASTGAGSAIQYTDASALTVDTVTANGCFTTTTVGIVTNNGNLTLNVANALTINRNLTVGTAAILINAGLAVAADVTINNTAVITAATTTINTGAGADALIINSPAGSLFAPSGAFTYNAGGQAGDRLEFNGGGAAGLTESYTVGAGNNEGTFAFTGLSTATLAFTGVTSPILDSITAGTLLVIATNADNAGIFLDDSPVAGRLRVSVDAFQPIDLTNKTNLTISGQGGNDTITLRNTGISAGLVILTANGDGGNDTINVLTTRVTTAVNGGDGTDVINVGSNPTTPASSTLSGLAAGLVVNGNDSVDTLNVNDAGFATATRYEITSSFVQRANSGRITYATIEALNVNAGTGSDAIVILSTHAGLTVVSANAGNDVVSLCNGIVGRTDVAGDAGDDQFAFQGGANLAGGFIDGGTGVNLLNYSGTTAAGVFAGYTTAVTVNLSAAAFGAALPAVLPAPSGGQPINVGAGAATGAGGVRNIRHVIGGRGNDLLIGDGEANQLEGREGNDILFGQGGLDSLLGGTGGDILLGGDDRDLIDALSGETTEAALDTAQNFLFGGNGDDVLYARTGQDWLFGENGPGDILVMRNCPDFFAGQLRLDTGADGGRITILDFAVNGLGGEPVNVPPRPLGLAPLDCNQTLVAVVPPVVVAAASSESVTSLPARFLGAAESKANLVRGYYQRFLGRTPEAAGLQQWVAAMTAGMQPEDVLAGILGSAEYFGRFGNDPAAFVRSLYQDLLGRSPAAVEVAGWVNVLGARSRAGLVRGFVTSDEFRSNLIQSWYNHYLGRAADPVGVRNWLAQMQAGATQDQIQAALLASAEYRQFAGRNFSLQANDSNAAYVRSLYNKVLGRTAGEAEVVSWLRVVG